MKRKLSLLLAVVMILGSFSFAFAADVDPVEFLEENDILKGDISGDLMLDEPLLRRDAVVLLSRLLGVEEEAEAFEEEGLPTFNDLTDNKYYRSVIAWAESNGYYTGNPDGSFGYLKNQTAKEYAIVLLRALGYGNDDKKVEWDNAWELAKELDLLANVEAEANDEIARRVIAQMTYNALGTTLKDSEETLAEKLGIDMPVPEVVEIKEVKADNLKEIKVVFNKAVNDDAVTDSEFYTTTAGNIEKIVYDEDANAVVITLVTKMTANKEYKLTIKGLKVDGVVLDDEVKFVANDNAIPEVVNVEALGTKAIKVTMSEPVVDAKAANFKLNGKSVYAAVKPEGREIFITPYTALAVGEHELTVTGLVDYAGFKSLENKYAFEVVEDKVAPEVVDVKATLEKVVITFSEDVDPATVVKANVYWKSAGVKQYPDGNGKRLAGNKYEFEFTAKPLPVHETTLFIEGVKDYSGNKMEIVEWLVKATIDETRPEVVSYKLLEGKKSIEVKFSKALKESTVTTRANYTVLDEKDNKIAIREAKLTADKTVVIELYDALKDNKQYTLKISGLTDRNKYANVMYDFTGTITVGDYTYPKAIAANGQYKVDDYNRIYVFFDKEMDLSTLVNPENYLVVVGSSNRLVSALGGTVDIAKSDGTVVVINVPVDEGKVNTDIKQVAVLGVKDTTGKTVSNYGELLPITSAKPVVKANGVVAEAKDKVTVKFDQPIMEVKDGAFKVNHANKNVKVTNVTGEGTDTLTLTVDELTADAYNYTLEIVANKVYGYANVAVDAVPTLGIVDEIAPSIEKVTGTFNNTSNEVVLTVEFDEDLDATKSANWAYDLKVTRIAGGKKVFEKDALDTKVTRHNDDNNKIVITFNATDVELDSRYIVEIVSPKFITDNSTKKNEAKAMSKETEEEVDGVALYFVTQELNKVTDNKELDAGSVIDAETVAEAYSIDTDVVSVAIEATDTTDNYKVTLTHKINTNVEANKTVKITVAP